LVTPTGAAIISTVCKSYGPLPPMRVAAAGYGAGGRTYEKFPNALRVFLGDADADAQSEKLLMIETNLDDASPQIVGHVMDRAFGLGALDCYFTPAQMKKNRPGVLISILCRPADRETLYGLLFDETTTLGVRSYEVERRALGRELVGVETEFGRINVKIARRDGRVVNLTPEYDDCREAALRAGVALRTVESAARAACLKSVIGGL
ncbi:MAG: LarC family nickel insertion protein, partial [Acidobacteria bacterium]|nr:LarC family nickel insertion protein [Acidobacteriota bacterium]